MLEFENVLAVAAVAAFLAAYRGMTAQDKRGAERRSERGSKKIGA